MCRLSLVKSTLPEMQPKTAISHYPFFWPATEIENKTGSWQGLDVVDFVIKGTGHPPPKKPKKTVKGLYS